MPPKRGFLEDLTAKWGAAWLRLPKGSCLHRNTSYDWWIVKIGPRHIALLTLLPNRYTLQCFSVRQAPHKCRSHGGICTPSNTWFTELSWLNLKLHLNRFSHFCTSHGRVSLYFTKGSLICPQNCSFAWGDLDLHIVHDGSLVPPEPTSQRASRSAFAEPTVVTHRQYAGT